MITKEEAEVLLELLAQSQAAYAAGEHKSAVESFSYIRAAGIPQNIPKNSDISDEEPLRSALDE